MNFQKKRLMLLRRCCRYYCTEEKTVNVEKQTLTKRKSHKIQMSVFFRNNPHLQEIKLKIPEKYLTLKKKTPSDNLYLIDKFIAKKIVSYVLPLEDHQIIAETNAGLGLIAQELLESGVKLVRLYESCPEFKVHLKQLSEEYPGRVEIFHKDIFLLHRFAFMDKEDHGNRVEQLLKGIPKKSWNDSPCMTIIGTLANNNFIRFLIKSLMLQTEVVYYGRIQLYVVMKPKDYIVFTAGPHLDLHTYQALSVIFNLFFDWELLDKFPRRMFLPWETQPSGKRLRFSSTVDTDLMYFVRINLKKNLPVSAEHLLSFYYFVRQFFGKGTTKVIPTLEKWIPGSGLSFMLPTKQREDFYENMTIFTRFGELTPKQILYLFEEVVNHQEYQGSPFKTFIESQLIKTETIESSLDEHLEKTIVDNIINNEK